MSIASTSNRWLNRLYKTVAILLVFLAVLISAFRLFLPYVGNYRIDLQNYLNDINQTNSIIGSLNMTWQRKGPVLLMGDVSLIDSEQAKISIDHIELQVDFWQSISQRRLISSNLVLTGADIYLDDGLWQSEQSPSINNSASSKTASTNESNDFEQLANIFLNRLNQFSIKNSHVVIKSSSKNRDLHINKLTWVNKEGAHKAQGSVVANRLSSNNLHLRLKLIGDHINELNGKVYLEGNNLDVISWLDNLLAIDNDKTKTDISFATWLTVNNSSIDRLQVELAENKLSWVFDNKQQNLTLGKGQLLLVKGKQKQSLKLFSTPFSLQFNQQVPQTFTAIVNKKSSDYSAYFSTVDLSLASQLAPLFIEKRDKIELVAKLALVGQVNDLFIRKKLTGENDQEESIQVVGNFSNVSNDYSYNIPGIENISGQFSFDNDYLALELLAEQGSLDFDKHFVQPFKYKSLRAQANMLFDDKGWTLAVNELDFVSDAISLTAQVELHSPSEGETIMALLASVKNGNAGHVGRYLPLSIMNKGLVTYLNDALVSGTIEQADVLLNGPLAKFPFTDNSGIFVVNAELTDSTFKFVQDWPAITHFSANLNFTNNSMLITGREGDLVGLDVTGVRAEIIDLADKRILTVDTIIKQTPAKVLTALMNESPLKDPIGNVLDTLRVGGDITGELDLHLPLKNLDNTVAAGKIYFSDNTVALQTPRMNFSNVNGQLLFINDVLDTKDLTITWQGLPLALQIKGNDKSEYYHTGIELTANWQQQDWQQHVPIELQKYLQGQVNWQGDLSLHQHHQGGFSYNLALNSDLYETSLNLPAPYGKKDKQHNSFEVNVNGQQHQSKITAQLDDSLNFFGVLNHEYTRFSRAHLVLGDETMLLPMDGFHITTNLQKADFSLWQPLLSDVISSISSSNPDSIQSEAIESVNKVKQGPLFAKPERIRGTIGKLAILGQELNNVSFNLLDEQDWWLLQLNAKETRSQLKFYPNWLEQGVDINAEFIHLKQNVDEVITVKTSALTKSVLSTSALTTSALTTSVKEADSSKITKETKESAKSVQAIEKKSLEQKTRDLINTSDSIFASIPPIKLHCDRCQIDSLDLGQVDFTVERSGDDKVKINNFKAERQQGKLDFSAVWLKNEEVSQTTLVGKMSINSIEYELKQLGFDSIIRDSGGEMEFNLSWLGGPHDFDFANLNGEYKAELDDGYLAEVSDKARIFSLLSLESLLRKLTLDFRDIFSDGMFYSDIQGDYKIDQGILTTQNTQMNGTAGNLVMTGQTNLATGELDYKMSYKPNLSSSLPVLAWIATLNPVTFLAGVAIDQVIKSQVVSELEFTLTGTVSEPNVKEVNRKNQDVSVDASLVPEIIDSPTELNKLNKNGQPPEKKLQQYNRTNKQTDKQKKVSHKVEVEDEFAS